MDSRLIGRRQVLHSLVVGGLATAVLACASPRVAAAEKHPHIRDAIKEMKEAKKELEEGAKIFGGHRVKAIKALDEAIEQLRAALEFAEK